MRDGRAETAGPMDEASPGGKDGGETKEIETLIWYSFYKAAIVLVVDGPGAGGSVQGFDKNRIKSNNDLWWRRPSDSPVISRTVRNTLSFSGSSASMLW